MLFVVDTVLLQTKGHEMNSSRTKNYLTQRGLKNDPLVRLSRPKKRKAKSRGSSDSEQVGSHDDSLSKILSFLILPLKFSVKFKRRRNVLGEGRRRENTKRNVV
jgi:hypothetical protein